MKIVIKFLATFGLIVMASLIVVACSSSGDDVSSGKAAVAMGDSDFQLVAPFTEKRPKIRMAKKYSCHGENLSPHLSWLRAPEDTISFALVAEDVDHKTGDWVHWVVYNIPGDITELVEGIPTSTSELPDGTVQGLNDFKTNGYNGPCPLEYVIRGQQEQWSEKRVAVEPAHKYRFAVYALDTELDLPAGKNKLGLLDAMEGHILDMAETFGKFQMPIVTPHKQELNRKLYGGFGGLAPTSTPTEP